MLQQLISHSPDLKRLLEEGYDIEVRSGHLMMKAVPYVDAKQNVRRGTLVCPLDVAGDATQRPSNHQAFFAGDHPCYHDGTKLKALEHSSARQTLAQDVVIDHSFSTKPRENGGYRDFHHKMTHYAAVIANPARTIDPTATAQGCQLVEPSEQDSVFCYLDTASSRAGIAAITAKLEHKKLAIVGLGGTGSYVLDLVAKTPVGEIHLFDGDFFSNHSAFRAPGAPSIDELRERPLKVAHLAKQYSRMHRRIIPHDSFMEEKNVDQLRGLDFVFLCLDRSNNKVVLIQRMEEWSMSFIDVGMGVETVEDSLRGIVRVTISTPQMRTHVRKRVPLSEGNGENEYSRNIQIAELNALNAALAVIKWKKYCGIYQDLEHEHCCAYTINGNTIANEDQA